MAQQEIDRIDQLIDANRRALMARLRCDPGMSAHVWQNAWDRCPDLRTLDNQLFRQRGEAQERRDQENHRAWQIEQRRERAKAQAEIRARLRHVDSFIRGVTTDYTSFEGQPYKAQYLNGEKNKLGIGSLTIRNSDGHIIRDVIMAEHAARSFFLNLDRTAA